MRDRVAREVRRRLQLGLGLVRAKTQPRRRRPLWLFGGFVGAAFGDNAAALFRYVRAHRPDVDAVWAIDPFAVDAAAAAAVGPIVDHGSVKAAALAAAADVLVISHGLHDVPGYASRLVPGLRVRLGHGLTAFKKTKPPTGRSAQALAALYDVVPVASDFERANKREWGLTDAQLPVCGVCRFDDLLQASAAASAARNGTARRLLYMPTWRDWLSGSHAVDDDAVRAMVAFVSSPALAEVLAAADLHLDLYAHRLLSDTVRAALATQAGSPRVHIVDRSADVQQLLARASALLTDYSSVTWDMLYVDRPALFFAPDVDAYRRARGAYFDLDNDLPGPVARNVDDAVALVRAAAHADFSLSEAAVRWQTRAFAWRDQANCARVVAAIEAALERRRGSTLHGAGEAA